MGSTITAQNKKIQFKHDAVDVLLKEAKIQNKLVFIDCYTSWCGPCKYMAKNIFTLDSVADFMNSNFISAKLDMESDEGIVIGKKYKVGAYPTYLFVDGYGNLIYKFIGAMSGSEFMDSAKVSLNPKNQYLSMNNKYKSGRYDNAFIREYIKLKFAKSEVDEGKKIAKDYFAKLSQEEKCKKENWLLFGKSSFSYYIAGTNSRNTNYLIDHWSDFLQNNPDSAVYTEIAQNYRNIATDAFNGRFFSSFGRNPEDFDHFKQQIKNVETLPDKAELLQLMDIAKSVCNNDTATVIQLISNHVMDFTAESQQTLFDFFGFYLNFQKSFSSDVYEIFRKIILSNKNTNLVNYANTYVKGQNPHLEKFDAENLKNKYDQKSIIPFFHPQLPLCYFSYSSAYKQSRFMSFDTENGTTEIINKQEVDSVMLSLNMDTSYVSFYPAFNADGLVVDVNTSKKNYTYLPKERKIVDAIVKEYPPVLWGLSPDKKYEVLEKNYNLYIRNLKDSTETQLTFDGDADAMYQLANLKWLSKKGKFIIYVNDNRGVREMTVVNSAAKPYPYARSYKDALPGDSVFSNNILFLGDVKSKSIKKVETDHWKGQELFPLTRTDNDDLFYFTRLKRTHDEIELCSVNANGEVKTIVSEKCVPNFNDMMFSCKIINKGKDILFWSDRTGWGHYYRYDQNGKLLNSLSAGEWTAGNIAKFDEEKQEVYFYGYGKDKKMNPNYAQLYKVNMDGSHLTLLTPENADHHVFIHTKGNLMIDNYSRIDTVPLVIARDCDGNFVDTVMKPDINELLNYGWKLPEQFTIKAADNETDLYGIMWKPFDFDPNKKYPIISQVYPGPFTETVWTDFTVLDKYQNAALAQRGFIVVCFGHRGSSPIRNKAYASYGFGNLRDYPLADDKYGIEQLARRYSFIDSTRVGILGHSGGAFMAVTAMCTYPDFYKVAVASSGNYDNTIYHKNWGEYYQGIGEDLQFKVKSPMELAGNLKGKLLLVTGESDTNVNPSHTYRMVDALVHADKNFDLLVLPGQEHHYLDAYNNYFERRKRDYFTKYLK